MLDTAALKERVARERADLLARLGRGEDGLALGRCRAAMLDALLGDVFAAARKSLSEAQAQGIALAAVGSYGRGAVALRSDADVRLIVAPRSKAREIAASFSERLLYPLWDAGLSIGHQVTDAGEMLSLAQDDLATCTTLLDLRFVAGERSLVTQLLERAWGGIFADGELASFARRLDEEAASRHSRFGGSVYLLEPDVKSGAGGLRDLDGARWAAKARFRAEAWSDLVRLGVLVPREEKEITAAEEMLWRVRNRLHARADRRSDRLTFDEQEQIAVDLGYGEDRAAAAERFMQEYYLHARVVTRARERLIERSIPPKRRAKPTETDLGAGVHLFDGQVTIAGTAELAADPALALRVYVACVRNKAPVFPFAREAIARAAADPGWCEALRASKEAADLFVELMCTVAETKTRRGSIAAELHDVGLLLAMIPEFAPVNGRVHHDVYHVYTVDVHSVAALDCLRALCRGEMAQDHPSAVRLAAEIARPRPLFLATLLHDIGKGYPDSTGSRKNHSQSGAELCDKILPRLGLSQEDTDEAKSLIRQHLAMYHVATRRDIGDPSTIEEFSRLVLGREGLRDLYLLTVADITTTSPTAMTSWKARMLEELYVAADRYLAGVESGGFDEERITRIWEAAAEQWQGPREAIHEFIGSMPERYLLANAPQAVVAHARVSLERMGRPVHAALAPSPHPDFAELCVVAEDAPGLLARIAAAITASRLEVLAAQVYSRPMGIGDRVEAVDLFYVRDRVDGAAGVARAMSRLRRDLDDVCGGAVDPAELLRARTGSASPWRERPSPAVLTEVIIDDRASTRHTIIEVFAKDRPGLLYSLARALHELRLSIALSKINTEGTKVADVFYVSELDGSKVRPGERFKEIRDTLLAAAAE
jgi:[protein-PII] uridylyltransferase